MELQAEFNMLSSQQLHKGAVFHSHIEPILFSQEPVKVVKPKPKKPSVEQKKTERVKTPQKRTAQVFQDFAESK